MSDTNKNHYGFETIWILGSVRGPIGKISQFRIEMWHSEATNSDDDPFQAKHICCWNPRISTVHGYPEIYGYPWILKAGWLAASFPRLSGPFGSLRTTPPLSDTLWLYILGIYNLGVDSLEVNYLGSVTFGSEY